METEVIAIDPVEPRRGPLARAAEILRRGGLVAFPTETVYGLGANALDIAAVAKIFAAKGRPATNPLIVHVASSEQVGEVAAQWPPVAQALAERFWPGPLTLVLPKNPSIHDIVTGGGDTVAVRLPAHPVARGLIRAAGLPIAAPSANLSTRVSPTRAEHVLRGLAGRIDLLLDGGPTAGGLESTVLDLTTTPPMLLRPGLVSPQEIEAVIGPIQQLRIPDTLLPSSPARSPGMLRRHYAPSVPMECLSGSGPRVEALCRAGLRVGWLTLGPAARGDLSGLFAIELPADPAGYSAQLYAALHTLEALAPDRIVVELPPGEEAWLAVRDRLRRAATEPNR
ncbi:MAG: threonylcarbamoyl-AMP synthase [Planctomycetia bacterium 21-64-5]|nr:MAG: threonylcarbamoyl-AMP synthase [Planctomycetia bacterium 21-64-5]HQU44815.1 L-threonylcarbamoyladenylate synthase [Pirellulales bacterium]